MLGSCGRASHAALRAADLRTCSPVLVTCVCDGRAPRAGLFIDGGLTAMWPTLDANTLIVTPLAVRADGRDVICPPAQFRRTVPAGGGVWVRHAPETAASAQHTAAQLLSFFGGLLQSSRRLLPSLLRPGGREPRELEARQGDDLLLRPQLGRSLLRRRPRRCIAVHQVQVTTRFEEVN